MGEKFYDAIHGVSPGGSSVFGCNRSGGSAAYGTNAITVLYGRHPRRCGKHDREPMDLTYVRPTQRTKVSNYVFDAFGPYPIAGAAILAGINQFTNSPPEWNQGVEGYGKRFGSDLGIAAVGTTTRYGLSEAFKEDALYYRCECSGVFPRLRHAVISTLTARRGEDGHRVFSLPALVGALCGHDDRGLWLVPQPLRRQGRVPDGQLQPAGIYGREHRPGVLL